MRRTFDACRFLLYNCSTSRNLCLSFAFDAAAEGLGFKGFVKVSFLRDIGGFLIWLELNKVLRLLIRCFRF